MAARSRGAAGIPDLKEEKSKSATLGFTWKPWENVSVTLDGYRIDIEDRIVLTGYFGTDDPSIGTILQQLGVGQAQFFVNSVDTKTQGIDLTVSHTTSVGEGELTSFLAFNHGTTRVEKVHTPPSLVGREDSLLGERDRLFIEDGAPRSKATLGFDYVLGKWDTNLKIIYFGPMTLGTFSGPPVPNQHYADKTSADCQRHLQLHRKHQADGWRPRTSSTSSRRRRTPTKPTTASSTKRCNSA